MREEISSHRRGYREIPQAAEYYVSQGEDQFGPMTLAQVQGFFRAGEFHAESYYWHAGMDDWRRLEEIRETLEGIRVTPEESREARRQRRKDERRRERKAALRQMGLIVAVLLILIAAVAGLFYFLGLTI